MLPPERSAYCPAHMKPASLRNRQTGYLIEIPLLLAAIGIVSSILLPKLPLFGQKIVIGIAVVPVLLGLFYMIVMPGWTPNSNGRLQPPWTWLVFLLLAALIVGVATAFILA